MLAQALPVVPPAPKVHVKDLPALRHLLTAQRNSIEIFPSYAFEVPFARRRLLGIDAVLVYDPAGVRQVLATMYAQRSRHGWYNELTGKDGGAIVPVLNVTISRTEPEAYSGPGGVGVP